MEINDHDRRLSMTGTQMDDAAHRIINDLVQIDDLNGLATFQTVQQALAKLYSRARRDLLCELASSCRREMEKK